VGTKNNPGSYDCYDKAEPDEPIFVLLGRDPDAPLLVDLWASLRGLRKPDSEKPAEARACAEAMRAWQAAHAGPDADDRTRRCALTHDFENG